MPSSQRPGLILIPTFPFLTLPFLQEGVCEIFGRAQTWRECGGEGAGVFRGLPSLRPPPPGRTALPGPRPTEFPGRTHTAGSSAPHAVTVSPKPPAISDHCTQCRLRQCCCHPALMVTGVQGTDVGEGLEEALDALSLDHVTHVRSCDLHVTWLAVVLLHVAKDVISASCSL